jgi:cyclic beta-1,2-glucan synthetase
MDFATRDRYRHVVEKIAKSSPHSESEVARQAIQLAHGEALPAKAATTARRMSAST